jgi:hypothetical protein
MRHQRAMRLLALVLLFGSGCAQSLTAPSLRVAYRTLVVTQHRQEQLERLYPGLPAVHLFLSHRLIHRVADEQWWFDHEQTLRYLLLAPRDDTFTTFTVTTKKGQVLAAVELVALYPNGTIQRFGRQHLYVQSEDDGDVTYKFIYPHTVKGTVIHERYVLRWPDAHKERARLFYHRLMLQSSLPVLHQRVVYRFPRDWKVAVKKPAHALGSHLNWRYVGNNWQEISYIRRNVPPLPPEPFTASTWRDGPHLTMQVQRMHHRKGTDLRPMEWKHVSMVVKANYLEQTEDARRHLAPVAQAIIAGWRTQEERQRAIVRYVQRSFTVRSKVEWSIQNVLRAVGGSPAHITALTYHLLRQVGIPVEFVLIHDTEDGIFDRSFVSMPELDTPALLLNVGGQGKLAFPWLPRVPIGLVPARFQGQTALRISSAGNWKLYTTVQSKAASSVSDDLLKIRIDRQGRCWVRVTELYDGTAAAKLRNILLSLSPVPRAAYLAGRVRGPGQLQPVHNTRVLNLNDNHRPLVLESSYPMQGRWIRGPDERVLRLQPQSPGKRIVLRRLARRYRSVTISANRSTIRRYEISYPLGWRLVNPPSAGSYKNSFGSFRQTVTQYRGRIDIHQAIWFNRVRRPPRFVRVLQQLQLEMSRRSGIHLVFRTAPGSIDATRKVP